MYALSYACPKQSNKCGKTGKVLSINSNNTSLVFAERQSVLPCEKCVNDSIKHHENFPVPKLHNTKEKNQYLWSLRTQRGNAQWNKKVKKGEYTLETWINQFKNKPFKKLNWFV